MAANSGGNQNSGGLVDFHALIKPILNYSSSLAKQEIIILLKAIIDSEQDFKDSAISDHPHAVFYDVVTVLSAHVITSSTESDFLSRSSFPSACQAARILCESLLSRMHRILQTPHPILNVKIFVNIIQEFCTGNLLFSEEDVGNMLTLLRTQELPPKIQSTAPSNWDKEGTATVKEVRRNRLDPSVLLYDQIAMPVMSIPPEKPLNELFAQEVRQIFQTLRAGQKLVEYFLTLPTLKLLHPETINLNTDAIRSFTSDLHTKNPSIELTTLAEELNLVYRFLSIPIFSPLTPEDSHNLNKLAISSLNSAFVVLHHIYGSLASLSAKSTSTNNLSGIEYQTGLVIVSQAIWTNERIIQILKEDTGLPQWSWLNCSLVLSKILFVALHSYMVTISSDTSSSVVQSKKEPRVTLTIVQQLWNEIATAILSHGIRMSETFVGLLSITTDSLSSKGKDVESIENFINFKNDFRISNAERMQYFFDGQLNVIELMVQAITLSYRRACRLKSAVFDENDRCIGENDPKALTTSVEDDSNGNNLDMSLEPNTLEIDDGNDGEVDGDNNSVSDLMTTEDEDERDEDNEMDHNYDIVDYDDEPFLGKWLESVLNPPEVPVDSEIVSGNEKKTSEDGTGTDGIKGLTNKYVKDKDSALWFMKSGLTVLSFLTKKIVPSQKGVSLISFNEQTVALLALILKDLDQEKSGTERGAISSLYDDDLNRIFVQFSTEIGKLIQNLLAQGILSTQVLKFFLEQLNIDLQGTGRWPLGLQSRSLAVLVQVILLKTQDKETLVVSILKRVLETISEDISTNGLPPPGYSDLPVEHAQTLVFLFHTLSLMQKKAVMIDTARAVINVSKKLNGHIKDRHQLISLSRLLLLFDYFIRQLYEPSLSLISQVQYNLFNEDTTGSIPVQQQQTVQHISTPPPTTSSNNNKPYGSKNVMKKKSDYNFPTSTTMSTSNNMEGNNSTTNNLNGTVNFSEQMNTKLPPARIYYDNPVPPNESNEKSYDVKPKFYNLIKIEPNYQENPRLDGLAMNFLMNKNDVNFKDKMSYSEVIEAVLRFVELRTEDINPENINIHQYIQYFLTRLIFGLPPPHEFLLQLEETKGRGDWLLKHPALLLYLIIWLPRLQNRVYSSWIRDIFSKQGLSTLQSEELAKRTGVSTFTSGFVYSFLEEASSWVNNTESSTPVYFYALEAAIVFAHENIDAYFSSDKDRTPENEEMENSLISTFSQILYSCMESIRKFIFKTAYLSKTKKRNVPLTNLELSTVHLMSISSSYLMQNCMAKIVIKNLDSELKAVMEKYLGSDFPFDANFPDFTSSKFNSDLIPSESYLLAIINGHSGHVILQINALKHILSSIIKLFGVAINGKNGKRVGVVPSSRKDKMSSILFPLLFDRVGEFLGETIGIAIDPIYTKTDVPLNIPLVELMASKTLQCLCNPELRAAIPEGNQDNFLEESFQALSNLLPEFGSTFVKIVVANDGDVLLKLFTLLMKTESEGVLTKLCEFLSMLLSQPSPDISNIILKNPSGLEDLPTKIFKLEFFQNESTVGSLESSIGEAVVNQAACKFFSALLNVLSKVSGGEKSSSSSSATNKTIIKKILLSTIEITKANLRDHREQQYKKDDKPKYLGSVHKCKVRPASFPHILKILIQMAGCAEDDGHAYLFRQMLEWLKEYGEDLPEQFEYERQGTYDEDIIRPASLDSYAIITDYMLDIGKALQTVYSSNSVTTNNALNKIDNKETQVKGGTVPASALPPCSSPPNEAEDGFDLCDSEGGGDEQGGGDDEDSGGEDSDDEGLNSRLCTYTITQKEFMSQHWYHCHTCGMVDAVGVCSICARVCHRGHDVTYAKFGSFFCDCGAKADGSCLALVRRPNTSANEGSAQVASSSSTAVPNYNPFVTPGITDSDIRRDSSPTVVDYKTAISKASMMYNNSTTGGSLSTDDSSLANYPASIGWKGEINLKGYNWTEIMSAFKEFSENIPLEVINKLKDVTNRYSGLRFPPGKLTRVEVALRQLRKPKCHTIKFASAEDLVIPTLGSQEGAFENIKMQYNGDQGSTIRQLISSQVIRRVTVCSLSAPTARRHFLAVSQEKGKLTILQLGALLSGADAGKKKLTLPRLATLTLPFTALTMMSNPLRDDVIAVCGLKDCHVLVVGTGGAISSHLVLQLQLESQNHIIKPLWIPGSQTELCVVTSEAVKIYDVAEDITNPVYCFLLPTGRVRDATFIIQNRDRYIAIMSNDGRIYFEKLSNVNPMNGPYYITQDLNNKDEEMIALNESNASSSESKGVSLYYSHYLKLLFYTYPNGKSYVSTLDDISSVSQPLDKQSLISPKGAAKPTGLGLAQWTEVVGHPGLVFALGQNSTPYVLFMSPKGGTIQEIRMVGKIKPIDIVALRHGASNTGGSKMKTSLLILCDDGSLRVYDSTDTTEFWINPRLRPQYETLGKPQSKKSNVKKLKCTSRTAGGQVSFPTDFFEHCQPMNDVDYGGNDLLQIYNVTQLRNRVNNPALRHGASNTGGSKMKTSLLILCDDGSLRVYDSTDTTEFWINPRLRPQYETLGKPQSKKSNVKKLKCTSRTAGGQVSFPTDFFEHCQPMNDVDYGGNDLLQIYNVTQLRNRVNNPGMYVVSTKSIGFNLEVSNNDASMVMTGVRILLGTQDINRVPSFIQIFGRTITVNLVRPRWYDIPLTREESLQADSKLVITFGPSNDPQCITFVDTVKIYGKNKDAFGWPDDSEEIVPSSSSGNTATVVTNGGGSGVTIGSSSVPNSSSSTFAVNSSNSPNRSDGRKYDDEDALLEKVVVNSLELCEISVNLCSKEVIDVKKTIQDITHLYTENYPPFVSPCRNLIFALKGSKSTFYEYRDQEILDAVMSIMKFYDRDDIDSSTPPPSWNVNPEQFCHIINCIRNVAVTRPQHITQYNFPTEYPLEKVMEILAKVFNYLQWKRSNCPHIESVDYPGIQRVETVTMAFADTLISIMMHDITKVEGLARQVVSLLLSPHRDVSVPVRTLLVKKLRPKSIRKRRVTIPGPSPPHCASPDTAAESPREASSSSNIPGVVAGVGNIMRNNNNERDVNAEIDAENLPLVEVDEPIVMLGHENEAQMPIINALDAFMGQDGMDLQSDAEDEAMVELAIALSLQEQVGGAALAIQGIQEGLQALEEMHQEVLHVAEVMSPPEDERVQLHEEEEGDVDGGAESDTASPPPSDDDDLQSSTVATTESSIMNRNTVPGGNESIGSGSGRSERNTGHTIQSASSSNHPQSQRGGEKSQRSGSANEVGTSGSTSTKVGGKGGGSDKENNSNKPNNLTSAFLNTKPFRLALMKYLAKEIPTIKSALDLIPLLQVMLVILAELDGTSEEEKNIVSTMVQNLVNVMCLDQIKPNMQWKRDDQKDRTLIALRMLSILVSRWRGAESRTETGTSSSISSWIARITADIVLESNLLKKCKDLLLALRSTWRGEADGEENSTPPFTSVPSVQSASTDSSVTLLKPYHQTNPPDFSPFFLKQYIKTHCNDIMEELPLLLSEMALRFPYQVKKIIDADKYSVFDAEWEELLCEILQNRNAPFVRRQARKLLLNIAGTRENYHLLRDVHNIKYHLSEFKNLIGFREYPGDGTFTTSAKVEFKYSQLVSMVEQLNTCIDIATQRPSSWQTYCRNDSALKFIIQTSCTADESLTSAILSLLKIAIDGVPFDSKNESPMLNLSDEEKKSKSLAHQVIDTVEKRTFLEFVKKFLLEHPVLTTRWQAHALLLGFFLTSDCAHQLKLVNAIWELWPFVPAAGIRAAQFVDILGYATLNNDELKSKDLRKQVNCCIESIESQGYTLLAHPNASIYSSLVPFVSVEGFYLESEPCEVCYNIDKPYTTQKLNTIKADAKFTANSQIIKLASTLSVIRLSIRLTEVKKARMIKKMIVYYSPKNLPIVELKNKPQLWQKARLVVLSPSQTEIKLDFSVPITAANIMLEFLEFYDNAQATSETLQCPRCSASVPAQPGVCSNCGENVFQCHKCRAINYDERDPFLCHSCGFCKYAKMDISLLAKNVVAVDPIENEEDHKKAETAISSLLEKADQTYKQQQQMKGCLETMLQSIKERRSMAGVTPSAALSSISGNAIGINLGNNTPAPQSSYAAVTAAANALNNNVQNNNSVINTGAQLGGGISGSAAAQVLSSSSASSSSSLVLKNVQSLAYCYAIDCKNSYEELNRLMRKVSAYRKEMLKLDPTSYSLDTMDTVTFRRCYGCMASSITLSLKLLQALITAGSPRDPFDPIFLSFLLRLSQSAGSTVLKDQVKNALCFFVKDDALATVQLTDMITSRVMVALNKEIWSDVSFETSEEISLLASLLQMYDSCWEIKLRSLMEIFTHAIKRLQDPAVTEAGLLPCLKIIQEFIRATQGGDKEKATVAPVEGVYVNLVQWMKGDEEHSFEKWRKKLPKPIKDDKKNMESKVDGTVIREKLNKKELAVASALAGKEKTNKIVRKSKQEQREMYLMKTYGRLWLEKFFHLEPNAALKFDSEFIWMKKLIFCPGSVQTRAVSAALLKDLSQIPQRKLKIMELLTSFMDNLPANGESCREFMELYRDLASQPEFSAFLNAKGALNIVCSLLDEHIEKLHYLEAVTLHSDLSQGIAVLELTRLLSTLAIPSVRRNKRVSLLSTVLRGYLALKRLRLHRTRPIEEAQEILLQLLEEITTGTEEETKIFMSVCVETLKKCPKEDLTTPVFVFERLCSLIVHEENEVAEFFVTLDKDPQQEDFLQGRMLGNPYSSNESGIGPLMRDIKNKICTDCELVALLEDDNGMELLVNNRIISLDLPVKEVYKRIWLPTNGQIEPMRIVYRMRGLLGDATEEFVESFASPSDGPEDNELTYKLANVLVDCGGLNVVLNSLENLMSLQFKLSGAKPLIAVIFKLLGYCSKIRAGRKALLDPELNAVQILLPVLRLCLEHDLTCIQGSSGVVHLTDQVLELLDTILSDACGLDSVVYEKFAKSRGSIDEFNSLLVLTQNMKNKTIATTTLFKVLAALAYTDKEKMNAIFNMYNDCWDFVYFIDEPANNRSAASQQQQIDANYKMEQLCSLISNVEDGLYGYTFKDLAFERQIVQKCLDYIKLRAPSLTPQDKPDSDEWKEMVSTKPALKYVLRLLAGFASNHSPTQEALKDSIYLIHQLEQVSSDEHVGSLAENTLEALRSHKKIWKEVEAARRATTLEKKKMAMAMRQRQLSTMGMKTNDRGQVTAAVSTMLDQMEELAEETGLICVICREGYKYQPTKVLGIYTYSKRCLLEEHELKSRKTYGYCTVSHFNVVHVDCHMAAIRLARSRDEWESASLQNANTRCNGLIPLWGQQVPESAFAACLARHNAYLQEATGNRDVGFSSGAHDIKLLLLRFSEEKTFHEDTGGGGPESNMHLVPYLIHTALYVLNTTRAALKEGSAVDKFLLASTSQWKEDAYVCDGAYYHLVVSLVVHQPDKWMENRIIWLKRVLALCGIRSKKYRASTFENYRSGLIFLSLIHGFYTIVFKDVSGTGEWSSMLADYIRRNDEPLVKSTSNLLTLYQQKLLMAKTFNDFLEVLGLSENVQLKDFDSFIKELWDTVA